MRSSFLFLRRFSSVGQSSAIAGAVLLALTLHAPLAQATVAIDNDDFKKITTGAKPAETEEAGPGPASVTNGSNGANSSVVKTSPAPGSRSTASESPAPTPAESESKAESKPEKKTAEKKAKATSKASKASKAEKSQKTENTEKTEVKAEPTPRGPVDSETSLRWLTNGNTRFVKKQFRDDGRTAQDRERLMAGEHPHAIIIASSDSRVPPELIFDQALGEIYVVRTAGEALDNAVIASVEDALLQSSPRLIVVLGHTDSHMVELALKEGDAPTEAIGKVLADIRPRLKTIPAGKQSAHLEIEATVNADGVARDLVKRSDLIKKRVDSGELVIKPALYRLDSGKVTFY